MIESSIFVTREHETPFYFLEDFSIRKHEGDFRICMFGLRCDLKRIDFMDSHVPQRGHAEFFLHGDPIDRRPVTWKMDGLFLFIESVLAQGRCGIVSTMKSTLKKFIRKTCDAYYAFEEQKTSWKNVGNPNVYTSCDIGLDDMKVLLSRNLKTGRFKGAIKRRHHTYMFKNENETASFIEMAQTIEMAEKNEI